MEFRKQVILFLLILVTGSSFNDLFSQKIKMKPTRQSSLEAFSNGNYEQAYIEFSELLRIYSKDPLYNYYSGVCLVKLNRRPGEAVDLLKQAMQGAALVKTLPSDAPFYLGRALQMSGKFNEAIDSYNLFTKQVGKKTARLSDVPEFVKQCYEKKGEITEPVISSARADKPLLPAEQPDTGIIIKDIVPPVDKVVMQPAVKENLPVSYEKLLDQALEFQFFADSLNSVSAQQKKEIEKLSDSEKTDLKSKISENELLAVSYQKLADQKYSEAQAAMNPLPETVKRADIIPESENKTISDSVKKTGIMTLNDSVQKAEIKALSDSVQKSGIKTLTDSVQIEEIKTLNDSVRKSESIAAKDIALPAESGKKITPAISKPVGIFSVFDAFKKPGTDSNKKILVDPEVPDGLVYRIQMAVFRNPVALMYFKGITPVYGFRIQGTENTTYFGGMFRRISDARIALAAVRNKGFKDAFIVAFAGKKVISADRAVQMEKEWGNKPLITVEKSVPLSVADTIPPTLSFCVEVIRSVKPFKEEVTEGIKKLAGSRVFNIKKADDGNTVCYVGKFITFESAAEYADLMKRNGYRDAHVVAFLGVKEVPVETARQLFENLK